MLRGVPGSKVLTERLIQAAGQRLGRLLSEEAQSTRKALALAQVSPQVLEWISQQVLVVSSSDGIYIVVVAVI